MERGKYSHLCPELDFMEVDENHAEFLLCLCFTQELSTARQEEICAWRWNDEGRIEPKEELEDD